MWTLGCHVIVKRIITEPWSLICCYNRPPLFWEDFPQAAGGLIPTNLFLNGPGCVHRGIRVGALKDIPQTITTLEAHNSLATSMLLLCFHFKTPCGSVSDLISVHTKTPENPYHVTTQLHWARDCQCRREANWSLRSWLLNYRRNYEREIKNGKNKSRGFLSWVDDEVELLLTSSVYKVM